jgi:hypothetical protein
MKMDEICGACGFEGDVYRSWMRGHVHKGEWFTPIEGKFTITDGHGDYQEYDDILSVSLIGCPKCGTVKMSGVNVNE